MSEVVSDHTQILYTNSQGYDDLYALNKMPRLCPYSPADMQGMPSRICGSWCALFEKSAVYRDAEVQPGVIDDAFIMVRLNCSEAVYFCKKETDEHEQEKLTGSNNGDTASV